MITVVTRLQFYLTLKVLFYAHIVVVRAHFLELQNSWHLASSRPVGENISDLQTLFELTHLIKSNTLRIIPLLFKSKSMDLGPYVGIIASPSHTK